MACLHALCLRPSLPVRAAQFRTLAVACAGLEFARLLAPDPADSMLVGVAPLRRVGLATALWETVLLAALRRFAFAEQSDMATRERHGVPPLLARPMVLEARFCRRVLSRLRGR